ncbi:rod shape-determining protein [Lyngbya confervoides]|uniref:Cell shape-determining protein MreB n=1 Tax=Lyngbya confervoides BDU141951 TaxID=1574623 RepID=A0ABD4SZM0_9CYAN|nr:rod shape-determining protein [Lyngbya confervoides]MCM1981673.1 rod shape-determining protein [Lyngbya confervoides BDU141951]
MRLFHTLSIDLGTANTLILDLEHGIVLKEPTVIALDSASDEVVALGQAAEQLRGRISNKVVVKRPLKDGVIVALDAADLMLSHFIRQILGRGHIFLPRVIVGVPSGATDIECRALKEAVARAGAKLLYLIDEPVAAAIGAGLPITEPVGSMVIDIGGGTSEVAVLSMAGVVFSESVEVAGDELTESIQRWIKQEYHMVVSYRVAEEVKHQLGSAHASAGLDEKTMEVAGINLLSGLPAKISLSGVEVREMMAEPIGVILAMIRQSLERLPPELAADLAERGIVLTGGGALLQGLAQRIGEEFEIFVDVPPEPLHCVVLGAGEAIANPKKYGRFLQKVES